MFVSGINLNIITIVLISMAVCMLIEWLRVRDLKSVCEGFSHFLKGMGTAFTGVVGLLVAAGVFAHGIKVIGAIDQLILMAEHVGLPPFAMAVVFALVTLAAAIIMGSEDKGIDEELINIATDCIKIPQKGQIESLNVSAAAAVLLFEWYVREDRKYFL